jgi:hypothetical protein
LLNWYFLDQKESVSSSYLRKVCNFVHEKEKLQNCITHSMNYNKLGDNFSEGRGGPIDRLHKPEATTQFPGSFLHQKGPGFSHRQTRS